LILNCDFHKAKETVLTIENNENSNNADMKKDVEKTPESGLKFEILELSNYQISNSEKKRKIKRENLILHNAKTAKVTTAKGVYYSLCFQNKSGGWVRQNEQKGVLGANGLTVYNSENQNTNFHYSIFESVLDYLAILELNAKRKEAYTENTTIIILNSTNNANLFVNRLKNVDCKFVIDSYLDNDKAGFACLDYLKNELSNNTEFRFSFFNDYAKFDKYYKDINDFLIENY
jgi:hypothetical protein